jgi:glutathione-independent formaldehyde dehydrogenase
LLRLHRFCANVQKPEIIQLLQAAGMVLGHEITGEVIEKGREVECLAVGDLVSVPFNVACGRCRTCREGDTGIRLHVNSDRAGGAYSYVDMGGWIGGQADN